MNLSDRLSLFLIWRQTHKGLGTKASMIEFRRLCRAYDEPHRHYHTLRHIKSCLDVINTHYSDVPNIDRVRMAIFYHDIVYDVKRKDNEFASANIFTIYGIKLGLPVEVTSSIGHLIDMTATHKVDENAGPLVKVMNDVDMSILAADEATYLEYARGVWREYSEFGRDLYIDGRLQFLETVDPSKLFHTAPMKAKVNDAVCNIRMERDLLYLNPDYILRSVD